jgi:hypothetical protein
VLFRSELLTLYGDDPAVPKNNRIHRNISCGGRWLDLYDGMDLSVVSVKDNYIADPVVCKKLDPETKQLKDYAYSDRATVEEFRKQGNMVTDADPGFVDVQGKDFHLRKDSPAGKLGFQAIPIEKIGLYVDEYRNTLSGNK